MPDIRAVPKKANYYRDYRGDTLLKHAAWQYMFGGILRAIFGVYSPAKYWNRDLEEKLRQELTAEDKVYEEKMQYGIFSYAVTRNTVVRGIVWKHGQKPKQLKFSVANQPRFFLMKGKIFYVRVNCLEEKHHVDIEFQPSYKWGYPDPTVITAPLSTLQRLLQGGYVKRIADHKLWKLKKSEL